MLTPKAGSFNVTASCKRFFFLEENVTATINYDVIAAGNTTILKTGVQTLPNKAIYPVNTTIDVAKFFSGPLVKILGNVTLEK